MLRSAVFFITFGFVLSAHGYPIPLGSGDDLHLVAEGFARQNPSQLSAATLTRILIGVDKPSSESSSVNWRKSLNEALEKDALFEVETAQALRQEVQASYETQATLSLEQVNLRARMGHDSMASFLAEGQKLKAVEIARETIRRFRDIPIDRKRHSPTVINFFNSQKKLFKNKLVGQVLVQGTLDGTLYADGNILGTVTGKNTYTLPHGQYRLWIHNSKGQVLVRALSVGAEPIAIELNPALDHNLRVIPHPHLVCDKACNVLLGKFAQRLGTTTLPGVRHAAQGNDLYEIVTVDQNGKIIRKTLVNRHGLTVELAAPQSPQPLPTAAASDETPNTFNALWLIPGGVGQFSQGRVGWGIAWAVVEASLLAWNIQAATAYYGGAQDDPGREDARKQAIISGAALYSTLAIGVVEAVVSGMLIEPQPE